MTIHRKSPKALIEAALLSSKEPLCREKLQQLLSKEDSLTTILAELEADCQTRGIELQEVASGYRFQVRRDYVAALSGLHPKTPTRYTQAVLETLALIVYRQPITRSEIEAIRGTPVSGHTLKILQERNWIKIVGHADSSGSPALWATTSTFLDDFNLKSLTDLPNPQDFESDSILAENPILEELNALIDKLNVLESR